MPFSMVLEEPRPTKSILTARYLHGYGYLTNEDIHTQRCLVIVFASRMLLTARFDRQFDHWEDDSAFPVSTGESWLSGILVPYKASPYGLKSISRSFKWDCIL